MIWQQNFVAQQTMRCMNINNAASRCTNDEIENEICGDSFEDQKFRSFHIMSEQIEPCITTKRLNDYVAGLSNVILNFIERVSKNL